MTELLCKECDKIVLFVAPDCDDVAEDCGDLMCVLCGTAITYGGLLVAGHDAPRREDSAA